MSQIDILTNKWFFSFVIGWVVFFFLIDWKTFHVNLIGGISACIFQLIQDTEAHYRHLYIIRDPGIHLLKSSFFFTFGVVFTLGVIFFQFLPKNNKLQLLHIAFFAGSFSLFEYILERNELLEHIHWVFHASFLDNILLMGTLAWLKAFVLYIHRKERK